MDGQVCMITGANSGIGKATALSLARMGTTVVLVCRNLDRGEAAQAEIQAASGNPNIDLLLADLSSQAEVRRLAQEFKSRYSHLHVLINNAGVALSKRQVTQDGIETVFAVNYLAPFLLTSLLLDMLKASAPARVVNVAGDYHRKALSVSEAGGQFVAILMSVPVIIWALYLVRRYGPENAAPVQKQVA